MKKKNETQCKQKQSNPKEVDELQSAKITAHPNSSKQIQTRKTSFTKLPSR
jgi:hypothetical protein